MGDHADALRHEMERHEMQGRQDRVEAIREELADLGAPETADAKRAPETAAKSRARRG